MADAENVVILDMEATVLGSRGQQYKVRRAGDGAWTCSCPAWRFQEGRPGSKRTCKHITGLALKLGRHVVGALD